MLLLSQLALQSAQHFQKACTFTDLKGIIYLPTACNDTRKLCLQTHSKVHLVWQQGTTFILFLPAPGIEPRPLAGLCLRSWTRLSQSQTCRQLTVCTLRRSMYWPYYRLQLDILYSILTFNIKHRKISFDWSCLFTEIVILQTI